MPQLQSAHRQHHSTETTLLRVLSDLLEAINGQNVALLGLLDLSYTFDTVDQGILLHRLHTKYGICRVVLQWIESFVVDRTCQVRFDSVLSSVTRLDCGVPQGSSLGPLLFLLCTAEILEVVESMGMLAHCYADDTRVYLGSSIPDVSSAAQRLIVCITCIEDWMRQHRLKMNVDKTQLILVGSRYQLDSAKIDKIQLGTSTVVVSSSVTDLGVVIDRKLEMREQVASLCKRCYYELRQLRQIRSSLT